MRHLVWHDLELAWRTMWRARRFSAAVLALLALGIGANTAVFTLVRGVLLRPLPYWEPDRLVRVSEEHAGARAAMPFTLLTHFTYHAWRHDARTLEGLAAYTQRQFVIEGESARLPGAAVSPGLFHLLRAVPAAGRPLRDDDAVEGAEPVVVVGHAFANERFGSRHQAIGARLTIDGLAHTVVGVMPPDFVFPDRRARLWTPYAVPPVGADPAADGIRLFSAVGRLTPGFSAEQAAAEGTAVARAAPRNQQVSDLVFGAGGELVVRVRTVLDEMTAPVRQALLVFLGGVGLLLLIACANVANLSLSRGLERRRDLAIQTALGARRGRLLAQLLTESLVLAVTGGVLGLGVGWVLLRALPAVVPERFPRLDDVRLDLGVVAFTFVLSTIAGLVAGIVPAVRGARTDVMSALREESGATTGTRLRRLGSALLVFEAALAVVLLVAAGLLGRSFVRLVSVDAGYEPTHVLTARVQLPGPAHTGERIAQLLGPLLDHLRTLPGVVAAGAGNMAPFGGSTAVMRFNLPAPSSGAEPIVGRALAHTVTPGYAEALGIRLRAGRLFEPADVGAAGLPLLVSEEFVRSYLDDGQPAVGRLLPSLPGSDAVPEIVGVVGNVLKDGLDRGPQPELYRLPPGGLALRGEVALVVRTTGDPVAIVPALRAAAANVDPEAVLDPVATLASQVERSVSEPRFAMLVVGLFAGLAALLAAAGLHAVLSHAVARHRREMGIRLALGAQRTDIVRLVMLRGLGVAVVGMVLGLLVSVGVARLMQGLLFGVEPLDPWAFVLAPLPLLAVALVATLVPARRAAVTDPADALRSG